MIMIYLLPLKLTRTIPNMASPALEIIEAGFAQSGSNFLFMKNLTKASASRASFTFIWGTKAPRIGETCDGK
jgi:hypothetical protein